MKPNSYSIQDVSVVIVTWKGDALLRTCLESLRKIYATKLELVIVDNAAQESTRQLVSEYPNASYLATEMNLGFAGANNRGLEKAHRSLILLLNNDTEFFEDSLSPLIAFLNMHARVGIVQGTLNIPSLNDGLDNCGSLLMPWGLQRYLHRGEPTHTTPLKPRRVFAAKGAFFLFRRDVLARVGFLFYDHFWSYYEEVDFCHRARLKGIETWFVPTPPVNHICGATSSRFPQDFVWQRYFRNILFSFWKNFGFWGRAFTFPCFVCAAFIKSPRALRAAFREFVELVRSN